MKQRLIASLLLLVVVVILMALYLFADRQQPEPEHIILSNIDVETINNISILTIGEANVEFIKKEGHWLISSPLQARASSSRVNAILQLPGSRSFAQIDTDRYPLGRYHLDPALLTLKLQGHEYHFGDTDPIDKRRYVRFENTIHLISDILFHQLRQPPMFFVSTRLVPENETITSIQFANARISRIDDVWAISPVNNAVEQSTLNELTTTWQTAQARQLRQYLSRAPLEKITVTFRGGRSAVFDVVSYLPELVLGRADLNLLYYLDQSIAAGLIPSKNTK